MNTEQKKITEIIKPKIIAEILNVSQSAIYLKLKQMQNNRFSEGDIEKIKEYIKRLI